MENSIMENHVKQGITVDLVFFSTAHVAMCVRAPVLTVCSSSQTSRCLSWGFDLKKVFTQPPTLSSSYVTKLLLHHQQWPCNKYAAAARWSLDVFFSAMGGGQVVRMIRPEWLVIQAADILPMMYWRIAQLTRLLATCNVVDLSHRAKCCWPYAAGVHCTGYSS